MCINFIVKTTFVKMSENEDVIMREPDISTKRGIPAVPTPDWTVKNFDKTADKIDGSHIMDSTSSHNILEKKKSIGNSMTVMETPQKMNSGRTTDIGSVNSIVSRFSGDVPSTPTHSMSAGLHNNINPHNTMTAATPAQASGVNQAINSIKLQNCVSTVNVGCELTLLDIYCKTRYSEYNPQRFQGVVMKLMEPRATALIFKSGKIVCTGARNEYDSYIAARKFARIIEKLGFPSKFHDFKIQNFCATADLKFPIRLEALQQAHGQFASYEPELFPGLVYRMVRPRVVLLIFVNGKIVFTGGKNRNEITEALEIIYPILRGYRIS